jgi:cysteine desulfurase / selenocysteine lyase
MRKENFSFIEAIRKDFPNISDKIIYFDSAATTQKPYYVIKSLSQFYESSYATVHRSIYASAQTATLLYHEAREQVASFLHASSKEIVFTKGTTDSLNILADSFSLLLKPGDVILVSTLEHHSNLIPWQFAARRSGATLKPIPITDDGLLCTDELEHLLAAGTSKLWLSHTVQMSSEPSILYAKFLIKFTLQEPTL